MEAIYVPRIGVRNLIETDASSALLATAVEQLPYETCGHEATVVSQVLQKQTSQHRGGVAIGELMPAVLARLNIKATEKQK